MRVVAFLEGGGLALDNCRNEITPGHDHQLCTGWGVGERRWGGMSTLASSRATWLVPLPLGALRFLLYSRSAWGCVLWWGLWVKGVRERERKTKGYEPLALHAPMQWAMKGNVSTLASSRATWLVPLPLGALRIFLQSLETAMLCVHNTPSSERHTLASYTKPHTPRWHVQFYV